MTFVMYTCVIICGHTIKCSGSRVHGINKVDFTNNINPQSLHYSTLFLFF